MTIMAPIPRYGGKRYLIDRLNIPYDEIYIEPFFGSGIVLFNRHPSRIEIVNDLDDLIVSLYRVLQDRESFAELQHRLTYTPYAREEFKRALLLRHSEDMIDRAWACFVGTKMGFSGRMGSEGNFSYGVNIRQHVSHAKTFQNAIARLPEYAARLRNVIIEHCDALKLIDRHKDNNQIVWYCDPPYVHDTRSGSGNYDHEMDDQQHTDFVSLMCQIKGQAVISGYDHELYKPLEDAGYVKELVEVHARATNTTDKAKRGKRTEVIWRKVRYDGRMF